MKISDLKQKAKLLLSSEDAPLVIDVLMAFLLKKDQAFLVAYPEFELDQQVIDSFWLMAEKFQNGMPLAYLTQEKEFYGLSFYVNENVLIPRPESEMVIDLVKELVEKKKLESSFKVLDVGTGSGNIMISLLKTFPEASGEAVDISEEALKVTKINAEKHSVTSHLELFQSDLLSNVSAEFDLIVANLPYIGTEKFNFVAQNVADFEPSVALYGGNDGLELYRKMFQQINGLIWKPKFLIGEFGFGQSELMEKELQHYFPEGKWEILKDYALIDRIFMVDFRR